MVSWTGGQVSLRSEIARTDALEGEGSESYDATPVAISYDQPLFAYNHYRWDLRKAFELFPRGFVQGNFDPALLLCDKDELEKHLRSYLEPLTGQDWPGWICGLGHGVLPGTPEDNVRLFVDTVREVMQ